MIALPTIKPTKKNLQMLFHESSVIEGFPDRPDMDAQEMVAWEYLLDACPDLRDIGHGDIRKVQKIITLRQDGRDALAPNERGYYRSVAKVNVTIAGRPGAHYEAVDAMMGDWIYLLPESEPIAHHVKFEKIHPFVDGNGRTGRQLLWFMQLKRGEDLTLITNENKWEYYELFR